MPSKSFLFFSHLFIVLFFTFSCKQSTSRFSENEAEAIHEDIQVLVSSMVEDPATFQDFRKKYHLSKDLEGYFLKFYKERDYELAWIDLESMLPEASALIDEIMQAYVHGLDSNSYHLQSIRNLETRLFSDTIPEEELPKTYVQLDFVLTAAYLTYSSHMLSGVIKPGSAGENWVSYPRKKDWAAYLQQALDENNIARSIESLTPSYLQYNLLKEKLADYRGLQEKEGKMKKIPTDFGLTVGDSLQAIDILKERLVLLGDLPESALNEKNSNKAKEVFENALASFQERHGILEDGIIGPETVAMLNVPIKNRIDQISLNMERLRWLPENFGEQYLLINIPDYQLRIMDKGKVALKMKVIVGKVMTETPVFSDTMEYVVFSPTWVVPKSISVKEMLPKIKEDDNYFERNNLLLYENWSPNAKEIDPKEVKWRKVTEDNFNFKIVEKPGENNALGSVKFMFPNSNSIYLHDTPGGHLFDQTERGFSHGCIRVGDPELLAEYLLKNNTEKWDLQKIAEYMALDTPTVVTLKQQLPIHIVYHSAWVDKEDRIHFLKDIYNHDHAQEKAIEQKEEELKQVKENPVM